MEIVLIAALVTLCWAVRRKSVVIDRPRKSYAARHLLGPLPEAAGTRQGGAAGRAQHKAGNPPWLFPAADVETDVLFDYDEWFPLFDHWMHPGRLPYFDHCDHGDLDPTSPLSPLYTDDINEPIQSHLQDEDVGQAHYDNFSDP